MLTAGAAAVRARSLSARQTCVAVLFQLVAAQSVHSVAQWTAQCAHSGLSDVAVALLFFLTETTETLLQAKSAKDRNRKCKLILCVLLLLVLVERTLHSPTHLSCHQASHPCACAAA